MLRRVRPVLEHLRRVAVAYVVLLAALLLTLLAFNYVRQNVEASRRVQFNETVLETREFIDSRVDSYVSAMLGARGLFYASDSVEPEEWGGYADGIDLERYEGMQVLGYANRVDPDERSAFDKELSRQYGGEGRPDPVIRPGGPERYTYLPIEYVEPLNEVNRRLIGQDLYADPDHRVAMDQARDTGDPKSTGKVYLLSEAPPGSKADLALVPGFMVYVPVYREGEQVDTVEERRSALGGFVVGALEAEDLLRDIGGSNPSVDFEIYDGERPTPGNLLYDDDEVSRAAGSQEPAGFFGAIGEAVGLPVDRPGRTPNLSRFENLDLAGQGWRLYFEALPGFGDAEESQLPLFVLSSGLAVSLLLFGVTYMLIRSRVRAEKAGQDLENANRELEATNRELEAFSYSVSHDLRAPLRSIDGFSQILLEDYAGELDDEGRSYLDRVRAASQKMGRLIDDLLGLSRVTRGMMNRERVDLSAMAEEVARGLREERPEKAVQFSVQSGLRAQGDPRLLRVALENLIGNAWKFTGKESEPRIEFGVDEELSRKGRVPVYYVRDNGAGFEMAYADKLFGAFQRLHGTEEFEGTGIGLATVQRIVHRHGGRIWARGEVGRGATFYFTLSPGLQLDPAAPRKEEIKVE